MLFGLARGELRFLLHKTLAYRCGADVHGRRRGINTVGDKGMSDILHKMHRAKVRSGRFRV